MDAVQVGYGSLMAKIVREQLQVPADQPPCTPQQMKALLAEDHSAALEQWYKSLKNKEQS